MRPTRSSCSRRRCPVGAPRRRTCEQPQLPFALATYGARITRDAKSPYERALAIERAVEHSRKLSARATSGSAFWRIEQFLFGAPDTPGARVGTSEQFATAFALLARNAGLPTRIVVGFRPGEPQDDGTMVVRGRDALAWPEVYFDRLGWVPFSPTPNDDTFSDGRPLVAPPPAIDTGPGDAAVPDGAATPGAETTAPLRRLAADDRPRPAARGPRVGGRGGILAARPAPPDAAAAPDPQPSATCGAVRRAPGPSSSTPSPWPASRPTPCSPRPWSRTTPTSGSAPAAPGRSPTTPSGPCSAHRRGPVAAAQRPRSARRCTTYAARPASQRAGVAALVVVARPAGAAAALRPLSP